MHRSPHNQRVFRSLLLAGWFLVTTWGLPLFTPVQAHPNCPCGCQQKGTCQEDGGDCCGQQSADTDKSVPTCCQKSVVAQDLPACCQQKGATCCQSQCGQDSQHPTAGWNRVCRCGQVDFSKLSLTEKLDCGIPKPAGAPFAHSELPVSPAPFYASWGTQPPNPPPECA